MTTAIPVPKRRRAIGCAVLAAATLALLVFGLGLVPYSAYLGCGGSRPAALPERVRLGLYEEFPAPDRLEKLRLLNFPVTVALAAPSRAEFLALRDQVLDTYPQVGEAVFWPVLAPEAGYYPGAWSDPAAVQQAAEAAQGLVVLWDSELPRPGGPAPAPGAWWQNLFYLDGWLQARETPVHLWRSGAALGLNPLLLRVAGLHYDPLDYPAVRLHLDLYTRGAGRPAWLTARVLRCGVERYGERFIPAFGLLDDGLGNPASFLPADILRRDLALARAAGVSEVWIFGVNGLNEEYLAAIEEAWLGR